MIRSILHLRPAPGRTGDLLSYIAEEGIVSRALALPGCLAAEVATSLPDGRDVVVSGLWASMQAYEGWLRSPERLRKGSGMLALLDLQAGEVAAARLYRVDEITTAAGQSDAPVTG